MDFVSHPQAKFPPTLVVLVFAGWCWLGGCSASAKKEVLTAETSNLKPLSILYGQYQARNENRAPADEADFRNFVQARGQTILEQFNTDLDGLLVSSRDGEPYVVVYRGDPAPPSGVVAYERNGVDGERIVAYPFGAVGLADEIRFRELVPDVP